MYQKILTAAVVSLVIAGWSGVASASSCKDVTIKVNNQFTFNGRAIQINVVDFDYLQVDQGKWRKENYVGNEVIPPNWLRTIETRNLEYVGDENVIVRVQYKYMTATKGWSETLNAQSLKFPCRKDGPNSVTVTVVPN